MIILNNLGKFHSGRLWVNQIPDIESNIIDQLCINLISDKKKYLKSSSIALELSLVPREVSNYALLGATYIPNEGNLLEICVNISGDNEKLFENTIALSSDEVHVGIPKGYAEAIINTAQKVINEMDGFPTGRFEFSVGAHGYVGSSKFIFSKVTDLIIRIMIKNPSELSEDELKELIQDELTRSADMTYFD